MDYNFARPERTSDRENAALEATPVKIPFESETHLVNSRGATDKCFFLRNRHTNEIIPYNDCCAAMGRAFYVPEYDLKLLGHPDFAGYVQNLRQTQKAALVGVENWTSEYVPDKTLAAVVAQIESGEAKISEHTELPFIQADPTGKTNNEAVAALAKATRTRRTAAQMQAARDAEGKAYNAPKETPTDEVPLDASGLLN